MYALINAIRLVMKKKIQNVRIVNKRTQTYANVRERMRTYENLQENTAIYLIVLCIFFQSRKYKNYSKPIHKKLLKMS